MAFDDTLFQLGMDLTRSSTTQTEDLVAHTSLAAASDRSGGGDPREAQFSGTHLIIDLFGASRLDDPMHVEQALLACVGALDRSVQSMHLHRVAGGLTGFAALEDGHMSFHARSASGYAAVDLLVAGDARPHVIVALLKEAFNAGDVVLKGHQRGADTAARGWGIEQPKEAPVRMQRTPRLMRARRVA